MGYLSDMSAIMQRAVENERQNEISSTTSVTTSTSGDSKALTYHQTAVIYDALSEGPIEGLVDQGASIKLGGNKAYNYGDKDIVAILDSTDVSYVASTGVITDHNNPSFIDSANTAQGSRDILVFGGAKRGTINTAVGNTIVSGASGLTFASTDVVLDGTKRLNPQIRITGAGPDGQDFSARITEFINTSAVRVNLAPSTNTTNAVCKLDYVGTVTSYNSAQNKVTITAGGIDTSNTQATLSTPARTVNQAPLAKYDNFLWAFRAGEREQSYLPTPHGIGSASVPFQVSNGTLETVPNTGYPTWTQLERNLGKTDKPAYDGSARTYAASGNGSMGVTDPSEVDLLRLTFNFPQGLNAYKGESNKKVPAGALFRVTLIYERNGTEHSVILNGQSSYSGVDRKYGINPGGSGHNGGYSGAIVAGTKRNFNYIMEFDISKYQPYDAYTIKVERISEVNGVAGGWQYTSTATLKTIENVILDKLSFPYTAYAGVIVDAKDFQSIPKRSYEIRGLKVKVPTNYFPKDEKTSAGIRRTSAAYTRNVTTGADTSAYTDWDGNFRGDKKTFSPSHINYDTVYTSNPVWVFLDIMTNPRYGLGQHVDPNFDFSGIDKYTLFALAKYCDELVPDGKGGTEPRFECNIYISKGTNALKILKDFCSTMRSMLIWWNGQVSLGANIQKGAVYTFTKSNVINGEFSYAGTANRFRNNQIVVTYNNPEKGYKQDVVLVEDNNDIAKTGKIKTKNVTAFGCTSKGQAIRYGKWHLASELTEKEVCNFTTGINGGMLRPGDVINIQDPDITDVVASGRVTTTSSSTTTVIKTDRDISGFLNQNDNFDLHLIYPKGGAYLSQQSATINSTNYRQGDLVLLDEAGAAIDTNAKSINCKDDAGAQVQLLWSEEARVETKAVSSFNASSVTVSSAFSEAPEGEVIYTVSGQKEDGTDVTGSLKTYMVSSIKEDFKEMHYNISAVEYNATKFDEVDRGYIIPDIPDVMRPPKDSDLVPAPQEVYLELINSKEDDIESAGGNDILVEWQHPTNGLTDANGDAVDDVYEHIAAYEIAHNAKISDVPDKFIREVISGNNTTSFRIESVGQTGEVTVRVRTINNIGVTSSWTQRILEINEDKLKPQSVPAVGFGLNGGIMRGGILTCPININSANGTVTFASDTYTFTSPNQAADAIDIVSGNTAMTTQADFNNLANGETGYLYLDYDGSLSRGATRTDLLQPVVDVVETTTTNADGVQNFFQYGKRLGESNEDFVQASGTVSVAANSVEVTGSSTTFDVSSTGFEPGDVIIIGDAGTTRFITTVGYIESNTSLSLTSSPTRAYSGANVFRQGLRTSNANDSILASVTNTGGVFSLVNFSSGNRGADAFTINGTNENHNFPSNAAGLVTDFSSFTNSYTVNKGTINYSFASSGSTPSTFGLTLSNSGCTAAVNSSSGAITVTAMSADTASITVTITDRETNETIATRVISLGKSIPGAAGAGTDSRTVNLTASDYSIVYGPDGANPSPSSTIVLTATAQNFTSPYFRFTGDGISDEGTFTANGSNTTTDTINFSVPSSINTTPQTIKVGVSEANQTELAFDTITLTSLQQGSQGTDGAPAYTAILTNEAHTFPASNTGVVSSFANSGTKIEVYKGATQLTPVANNTTPSTNEYAVTTSATNITPGTFQLFNAGNKNITVGNHSGVANGTDLSEIEYSIDIEDTVTLTKAQTFTKSKEGDDGQDGNDGRKVQELIIYYPVTFNNGPISPPNAPTTGTYNFGSGTIASIPSGWQQTIPTSTNQGFFYFTSEALATESSTTNVSGSLTWSTPGNNRNPANQVEFIFQRSATKPATPDITNYPVIPNNWYNDIGDVPAGSNPIWVSKGLTVFDFSSTFRYRTTWQAATRIEGSDGTDGNNTATLTLYKRSTSGSSAPAVPNGDVTYTFSSSSVTDTADLDGWSLNEVPVGTAQYLWSCSATATSNTATDVVATGEWSTPAIQSEAQQPRVERVTVYYDAWAYGALPSVPTATGFNFTSKTLSGLPSGWSQTLGVVPFAFATFVIKEATFESTTGLTITSGPVRPAGGKWELFDPDDIDITIDDTNNKIKFRPDNSITYKEAVITDKYRNDEIGISKVNGQIRLTNTGATTDVGVDKADVGLGAVANTLQFSEANIPEKISNEQLNLFQDGTALKIKFGSTTITNGSTGGLTQSLVNLQGVSNNANETAVTGNNLFIDGASQGAVKNTGIRLYANGVLTGANGSSVAVAANSIGAVQTSLANAPEGIKNASLNLFQDGTSLKLKFGSTTITNGSTGALDQGLVGLSGVANNADRTADNTAAAISGQGDLATRSDVRAGTHIKDSGGTTLGNDDIKNSSLDVDISGTSMRLKIGSTVTSTVAATQGLVGLSGVSNNANKTSFSGNAILLNDVSQGNVKNSGITLASNGVLSGGGTSAQVNIGSIASTPFNTSGDVDTGETIAVGTKITIDRDNERILIED